MSNVIEFTIHGVDKFSNVTGKLVGTLGSIVKGITKITAVGTAIAGAVSVPVLNTARSFEKMEASLKTVTGSAEAAASAMAGIKNFAQETPFQVEEITQAFIKLKALGLTPSEEALRSYGNTASAMGKSLNQMIEAVADATTGEFERLKEFGIKAASEGDRVTFTFNGVATNIGKNATEIEAYLKNIGEARFAGAMEEQMSTLDGRISNLKDTISNLFDTLGKAGALDIAKGAIASLTDLIKNSTDDIIRLGVIVGTVFNNIRKSISESLDAGTFWSDFFNVTVDVMKQVYNLVVATFTTLPPVIVDLFEIAFIGVFKTVQLAMVKVLEVILNGFPNVIVAIGGMFIVLWEGVKEGADWAWRAIKGIFSDEPVEPLSELLFKNIPEATAEARANIENSLNEIQFNSPSFIEFFKNGIPEATAGARDTLMEHFAEMGEAIRESIGETCDFVTEKLGINMEEIDAQVAAIMEKISMVGEGALEQASETATTIKNFWQELGQAAKDYMDKQGTVFAQLAQGVYKVTQDMIKGISNAVATSIVEGKSLMKVMETVLKQVAVNLISTLIEIGLQRLILGQISQLTTFATAQQELSANVAKTYVGALASMSAAPFPINTTAPAFAASMGTLAATKAAVGLAAATPRLREGLDRVPYENMMAILHKDEAVLTSSQAKDYRDGTANGGGGSTPIFVVENIEIHMMENATSFDAFMEMSPSQVRQIVEEKLIDAYNEVSERGVGYRDLERIT